MILRNELMFRKLICRRDFQENPSLYKVNKITDTEMKINLGVLLSGDREEDADHIIEFPDESAFLSLVNCDNECDKMMDVTNGEKLQNEQTLPLNELCAVIWDTNDGREWFIG